MRFDNMDRKLKFGLKLWSINTNLIDQAVHLIDEKVFDYIELMPIPNSEIKPFMADVPYVIHIPHERFGVNIGDVALKEHNMQIINESILWADQLDAKYLILHAGFGSMGDARNLLQKLSDDRILIENMPKVGLGDEAMIGYSPVQLEELTEVGDVGICLDFGHAVKASLSLDVDYKEYMKEFMCLKPKMFHISDGNLVGEKDEHMGIGEGEYDINYLLNCVKGNPFNLVTVETPRMPEYLLRDDIRNVNMLNKLVSND